MPWQSQAANFDGTYFTADFLESWTTKKRKVPRGGYRYLHLLQVFADLMLGLNGSGASNLLIGRQGDHGMKAAGLIEERLMPGNIRRRLPAFVVIIGKHR